MEPHNSVEANEALKSELSELSARVDVETRLLSHGFENNMAFQLILAHGERALPKLLEDLLAEDKRGWWRMQAIWIIAHSLGKTIDYPKEAQGQYDLILQRTSEWAYEQGYLTREDQ